MANGEISGPPAVDFYGMLSGLGTTIREAQKQRQLDQITDARKEAFSSFTALDPSSPDYGRQALTIAQKLGSAGDYDGGVKFLDLAQTAAEKSLQRQAALNFGTGLASLNGGGTSPATAAPASNPAPVPGARTPIAAPVMAGAPVPSSARVVGDDEGVRTGLYDPPKAAGLRPPVQVADSSPAPTIPAPAATAAPASPEAPDNLPSAKHIPFLINSLSNPYLPAGQRQVAQAMLTEAYKNAKEPEKIQTLRALQANPALLDIEKQLRAKTEVNIDQKGETEFAKGAGQSLSKRFEKLSEEGQTATQDLALVGQLRDLGAVVKTGAPAAIQGWLADRGIKVGDNVGAVEAYGSIIDKLTPQQRVPGSGATSDYEGRMFKNSLPKLINTPGGNEIISNTLAGLAQYKLDRSAIAEKALTREITPAEALKQMRELPNPYENFKNFAKSGFKADPNNPASATQPQDNGARVVPSTKVEIDQSLANARARIARDPGARSMVIQKLQEAGLPTDGL